MPKYFAKRDTTKAEPVKKGDIRFGHNLLDIVGETLMQGIQEGKFSSGSLRDFKADIDLDLGEGYSANLGYNQYIGDLRQDLKLTLSKKF
tara:strand:- start:262 stop:531 length:270 start_codon:yes stop_codon:yes gene_type:complete